MNPESGAGEQSDESRDAPPEEHPGEEPSLDETVPELESPSLRERLFIPELERMLGDPVDFPPNEAFDFDSIRVRLDRAIETVEKRSDELATEAYSRSIALRLGTMVSALVGVAALVTALGLPQYALIAWIVAAIELFFVLRFSRSARRNAVDCIELHRLAQRYRPELERATTTDDLRALAARIGSEMRGLWLEPPTQPPEPEAR